MQFVSENWKFRGADIALRNRHASVKTFAFRNWWKIQVLALWICSQPARLSGLNFTSICFSSKKWLIIFVYVGSN